MRPVTEFKFSCPVCHQHIMVASSCGGSQTKCPTCFRDIIVPKAPGNATTKLILRGTQPGGKTQTRFQPASRNGKSFSASALIVTVVAISLLLAGLVVFATNLGRLNGQFRSS